MDLITYAYQYTQEKAPQLLVVGWRWEWMSSLRRLGLCNYGNRLLRLSKQYAQHHAEYMRNITIPHELAHALTPHEKEKHGFVWKNKCLELGMEPDKISSCAFGIPRIYRPSKWVSICPNGHIRAVYRKPKRLYACRQCCNGRFGNGRFDRAFLLTYRLRSEMQGTPGLENVK